MVLGFSLYGRYGRRDCVVRHTLKGPHKFFEVLHGIIHRRRHLREAGSLFVQIGEDVLTWGGWVQDAELIRSQAVRITGAVQRLSH